MLLELLNPYAGLEVFGSYYRCGNSPPMLEMHNELFDIIRQPQEATPVYSEVLRNVRRYSEGDTPMVWRNCRVKAL
jgi:hypothetical protein